MDGSKVGTQATPTRAGDAEIIRINTVPSDFHPTTQVSEYIFDIFTCVVRRGRNKESIFR